MQNAKATTGYLFVLKVFRNKPDSLQLTQTSQSSTKQTCCTSQERTRTTSTFPSHSLVSLLRPRQHAVHLRRQGWISTAQAATGHPASPPALPGERGALPRLLSPSAPVRQRFLPWGTTRPTAAKNSPAELGCERDCCQGAAAAAGQRVRALVHHGLEPSPGACAGIGVAAAVPHHPLPGSAPG